MSSIHETINNIEETVENFQAGSDRDQLKRVQQRSANGVIHRSLIG